jgi:hypothetical protein
MISIKNYSNSKVYKIEPICDYEEGYVYFGSTKQKYLCSRMNEHRAAYKLWKNGKEIGKCQSFDIFDKYGVENCKIILLENVNANSKDELVSREGFYIRTLKCVNKYIPDRKIQEYKKEYYEQNKEILNKKKKEYYEQNKEQIHKDRKEYRDKEENKIKKSEIDRLYREKNDEKIKERKKTKITCECGCIINKDDIARHKRTNKHLQLLTELELKNV